MNDLVAYRELMPEYNKQHNMDSYVRKTNVSSDEIAVTVIVENWVLQIIRRLYLNF